MLVGVAHRIAGFSRMAARVPAKAALARSRGLASTSTVQPSRFLRSFGARQEQKLIVQRDGGRAFLGTRAGSLHHAMVSGLGDEDRVDDDDKARAAFLRQSLGLGLGGALGSPFAPPLFGGVDGLKPALPLALQQRRSFASGRERGG